MTRKKKLPLSLSTSYCDVQARRISRSRCSAESLDASGLQVIDSSMDLQLAARNLPPMFHTIQVRTYITKTHETSGYVSTVLFTTRWTAVWFCNLYDVCSSAFLVPTIPFPEAFFPTLSFSSVPEWQNQAIRLRGRWKRATTCAQTCFPPAKTR